MRKFILPGMCLSLLILVSCNNPMKCKEKQKTGRKNDYLLQSVLWYQHSGEMKALYYQAYNTAKLMLDIHLSNTKTAKKKAVIVDIDETLLNNSPLDGQCIKNDSSFERSEWKRWIKKAIADTLPGSLDFLNYAKRKGVEVYYISNRRPEDIKSTLINLRHFHFPDADEKHMLFKTNVSNSKESRRIQVARDYEVLLLCGDNLGDFSFVFENREEHAINDSVQKYKSEFGRRFIMLPNPLYGDWENTVYGKNNYTEKQLDSVRRAQVIGY
jgi:5'-nucleotidase (lipoprotein e(P4) family)